MKIAFIGAGNVAFHLSQALMRAGHTPCGVYSRQQRNADNLARRLGCPATTDLLALPDADACIFSVKDDALPGLIERFSPKAGRSLLLHTAGSVPIGIFEGKALRYGVLYPLQTFSKARPVNFSEVPCFLEASDAAALAQLRQLAGSITRRIAVLDSERRKQLHLAAVFACNFANHCCAIGEEIMASCGLPPSWLAPLIAETAGKLQEMPAAEAQTGPAARNDRSVMDEQEKTLQEHPEWLNVYRALSRSIHELNSRKAERNTFPS